MFVASASCISQVNKQYKLSQVVKYVPMYRLKTYFLGVYFSQIHTMLSFDNSTAMYVCI
jgi:hypothetical protein